MVELTLVVPTFNERLNVEPLLERLDSALQGISWEVVFVDDDSKDGTAKFIRTIAARRPNVRVLQRIGRRGLSSACIEGMLATSAPYLGIMDADLQHDETILPQMLATLKENRADVVIGSRAVEGGSMGDFAAHRKFLSNLGKSVSTLVCKAEIQDPMSGFFVLTRSFLEEVDHRLSGISFKILIDLLASAKRPVKVIEVPYRFRDRLHGESKLDSTNLLEYLVLLADKSIGAYVPVRYALFVFSGLAGAIVHLAILFVLARRGVPFPSSQAMATVAAIVVNFVANNWITYRDRRLKGFRFVTGLIWFMLACSVGGLANFALATLLREQGFSLWIAAVSGLAVSSVWNYGVTSIFTWRRGRAV